jgi:hypothetical protein
MSAKKAKQECHLNGLVPPLPALFHIKNNFTPLYPNHTTYVAKSSLNIESVEKAFLF